MRMDNLMCSALCYSGVPTGIIPKLEFIGNQMVTAGRQGAFVECHTAF